MKNTLQTEKQNSLQVTKIKSINQKVYKAMENFGDIILGENIEKIYEIYNTENNNSYEEYDLNGNKIKNIIFDEFNNIKLSKTYLYINNLLVEEIYDTYNSKVNYEYNSKGNLQSITKYDSENQLDDKQTFKYNENDSLFEINEYSSDGLLYQKTKHFYDSEDLLIKKEIYNKEGYRIFLHVFEYQKNQIVKVKKSKALTRYDLEYNVVEYDVKGEIVYEYIGDEPNKEIYLQYYYYNLDFFIELLMTRRWSNIVDSDKITFDYETDENKNWIKRIHYRNDVPIAVTVREIEYFTETTKEQKLVC